MVMSAVVRVHQLIDNYGSCTMKEKHEYIRALCIQYDVLMSDLIEYSRIERLHGR